MQQEANGDAQDTTPDEFSFDDYADLYTQVEFIKCSYRLRAIAWLHYTLPALIAGELDKYHKRMAAAQIPPEIREDPMWCEQTWLDVIEGSVPRGDAVAIAAGSLVLSCATAIEVLVSDLLVARSVGIRNLGGLARKADRIASEILTPGETREFLELIRHLANWRNSFAHRLIDGGDQWDSAAGKHDFNWDLTEEAIYSAWGAFHILGRSSER